MYTFVPSLGSKHVVHAGATDVVFAAFPEDADVGQVEVWSNIDGGWNAHTLEAQSGALAGVRLCRIPLKAYHNGSECSPRSIVILSLTRDDILTYSRFGIYVSHQACGRQHRMAGLW